jgi:hypothetical protein
MNEQIKSIIDEEISDVKYVIDVFALNINRTLRLIKQSAKLREVIINPFDFLDYIKDVTRAAIVFLHSTLETTIREIVRLKLKYNADISYISLAGTSEFSNRKEKFSLRDLAKHRGKTVDLVIEESIDEYLSGLSFNSTKDITDTFARIEIPQVTLEEYYPVLSEMINRRHQIVHEGDLKRQRKSSELEPIDPDKLSIWIDVTTKFCVELSRLTIKAVYLNKIVTRLKEIGVQIDRDELEKQIVIEVRDHFA